MKSIQKQESITLKYRIKRLLGLEQNEFLIKCREINGFLDTSLNIVKERTGVMRTAQEWEKEGWINGFFTYLAARFPKRITLTHLGLLVYDSQNFPSPSLLRKPAN